MTSWADRHGWCGRPIGDWGATSRFAAGTDASVTDTVPADLEPGDPVSFEQDIRPLFRERDRESMEFAFDLWSYDDVKRNAEGILARLQDGSMPCDGAWPPEQVDRFRQWAEGGMAA